MDRREQNHKPWYHQFLEATMQIVLEDPAYLEDEDERAESEDGELDYGPAANVVPAVFTVCETCGGKGYHVNPSIDSHGLTAADFAEDPDFHEQYFAGAYNVACYECRGRRVVPDVDDAALTAAQRAHVEAIQDRIWEARQDEYNERRYGY